MDSHQFKKFDALDEYHQNISRACPKNQKSVEDPRIGTDKILYGSDFPSLAPQVEMEKFLSLDIIS